jgi:sugar phosphate permease
MNTLDDPGLGEVAGSGDRGYETGRPTRVRFTVLALACVLAVITYIHRVGFATAMAEIKGPLGLSDGQLGWLMASFMVAYGLFEMPWGVLGDRLGVRNILAAIILGGSALTSALVLVVLLPQKSAWIFTFLLVVRFLFGAFQAGTFPAISRMMADWIPLQERGGGQGLLWMSSRVGGATAPSLLVWLIAVVGNWELPVMLAGALGIIWCAIFWPWFRNQPEAMRQVNKEELAIIASGRAAKATLERLSDALHTPEHTPPGPPFARGGKEKARDPLFPPLAKGGSGGFFGRGPRAYATRAETALDGFGFSG